ncbi:MAG: ATP-binding cassette domain-containing protein [Oscillospiraceae bacterium]|jgi:ATPase subunit of ABC transporter with duplicated ATPase domains|nr:ATP-binding cassette domain-containing protein [Oscillospiraceae bacterium]
MIEIALRAVVKAFERDKNVLDGVTFDVNTGERVGLLGKNGAGKTTLFRVISGEYDADSGDAVIAPGSRVGILDQIANYPPQFTVEDVLQRAQEPQLRLLNRMEQLQNSLTDESAIREYDYTAREVERLDAYNLGVARDKTANGLNISRAMRGALFSTLSGGEKTRVNLAKLLLADCGILLLDEPTNHLDMSSILWLEDYLVRSKRTILVISHDRYFLDKVVSRIVELTDGKATLYGGNYTFFAEEKERRCAEQLKRFERQEKEYTRLSESASRMLSYSGGQNRKMSVRAKSIQRRAERMRTTERPKTDKQLKASFSARDFKGDDIMLADGLSKSFGDRVLFSGVELNIKGGDAIALLGDNGAGKTTLLNIITNRELPDSGRVRFSPSAKCAFLEQQVKFSDPQRSAYDTMLYETNCSPQEARNRLGLFLFSGEDAFKPVSALSGGELSRLRLCILMREHINLLILDEPTNHLDIAGKEWLENALENYEEALLFVSHDRYFIERFATKIWLLENGSVTEYSCGYDEFLRRRDAEAANIAKWTRIQQMRKASNAEFDEPASRRRNSAKPKSVEKKLEKIERDISYAELDSTRIDEDIETFSDDYEKLTELYTEKQAIQVRIDELYKEWAELSE